MNKNCAIVIPIYKTSLTDDETNSLRRCYNIFGQKYEIILATKRSLDVSSLISGKTISVVKYDDIFFSSYMEYNRTCLSKEFYEPFSNYKYILIYQLDAWVIRDNLDYFINLDYDYYGAPITGGARWGEGEKCGCGGLSLRKVSTFIDKSFPRNETPNEIEDVYFCTCADGIKICPVDIGLQFCFSAESEDVYNHWFKKTSGNLPSFVHIFKKNDTWNFWKKYINPSNPNNIHFITFSNTESNFSFDRIRYEAEKFNLFESIETYTEKDFDTEYWNKNKSHFEYKRGYGYWSWKPYFISKKMSEINYGDVVVYADTGCMLLSRNKNTLLDWIEKARTSETGILSPCYGPYFEKNWTKMDAYKYINETYNKNGVDIFNNAVQCGAGILVVIKTEKSIDFMNKWSDVMTNHFDLITDEPSKEKNIPEFVENRHDQSIFSMLSKIYPIATVESKNGILNKKYSPIIAARCVNDKNTWKKPIKILFDSQIFDLQKFGGISKVFCELISRGDRNTIFENYTGSGHTNGTYNKTESVLGLKYTENQNLLNLGYINNKSINSSRDNLEYSHYLINNCDYDIYFPTFFDWRGVKILNGRKPFVMFIPDMITKLYPNYFPKEDLQNVGKDILVPKASAIFTPTENSKKDILKFYNIDPDKIIVIPHSVDENFGRAVYKKPPLGKPYILYVGQRNAYKRFDLFVKYISKVLKDHSELMVVCTGSNFNTNEIDLMKSLGVYDRFISVYIHNDLEMATIYYYAKMFVYSSEYEGFGIPTLEAFRMHCPVLLNNRSCFPEVAGNASFYFEMNNDESNLSDVAEKVLNLTSDERKDMVIRQEDRLKMYSWENASDIVVGTYNKILGI